MTDLQAKSIVVFRLRNLSHDLFCVGSLFSRGFYLDLGQENLFDEWTCRSKDDVRCVRPVSASGTVLKVRIPLCRSCRERRGWHS